MLLLDDFCDAVDHVDHGCVVLGWVGVRIIGFIGDQIVLILRFKMQICQRRMSLLPQSFSFLLSSRWG